MIQSEKNFRWNSVQVSSAATKSGLWSSLPENVLRLQVNIEKKFWDDENSWKMLNEQYSRNNLILEKSIKQQFVKNAHLHVKVSRYYLKERFIEPDDSLNESY